MLRVQAWAPPAPGARASGPVRLVLRATSGDIRVVAVDESGRYLGAGNLLAINPDGTIKFFGSVDHTLGFQRNSYGAIVQRAE